MHADLDELLDELEARGRVEEARLIGASVGISASGRRMLERTRTAVFVSGDRAAVERFIALVESGRQIAEWVHDVRALAGDADLGSATSVRAVEGCWAAARRWHIDVQTFELALGMGPLAEHARGADPGAAVG